ncbi:GNAT family N-acetyltransferase [Candidatus Nomurabacteria bacterium]|nr:GNAT family N-acetyltransferase [Candidatus Nomurabacteria bacterium]
MNEIIFHYMITISKAKPSECQKVRHLEQKVWKEPGVTSQYDIAFFVSFGYVFVAKDKDKIVGAIVAIKTKDNEIKITDWVIDKKYRRMGIGSRLYAKLKKEAKELPLLAYVEASNEPSIHGHQKLGFKKVKKMKDPFYLGTTGDWWMLRCKQ